MKVLFFSNVAYPFQAGGLCCERALRCLQLYRGLKASGANVVVALPDALVSESSLVENNVNSELNDEAPLILHWRMDTQRQLISSVKPDVVLYASGWEHVMITEHPGVPLVVDLDCAQDWYPSGLGTYVGVERRLKVFSLMDCALVSTRRQQMCAAGFFVQAGKIIERNDVIRVVPVIPMSTDHTYPEYAVRQTLGTSPRFLLAHCWGGVFEQSQVAVSLARSVLELGKGAVEAWGELPTEGTVPASTYENYQTFARLAEGSHRLHLPGSALGFLSKNHVSKIDLAVELHGPQLQQQLRLSFGSAMLLSAGIPLLCSPSSAIGELVGKQGAGWLCDAQSEQALRGLVEELSSLRAPISEKRENARKLRTAFPELKDAVQPLTSFCHSPFNLPVSSPAYGLVSSHRPRFSTRKAALAMRLSGELPCVVQHFTVPTPRLAGIELCLCDRSQSPSKRHILDIVVEADESGPLLRKRVEARTGRFVLQFPLRRRPKGGERLRVTVNFVGEQTDRVGIMLEALVDAKFPFGLCETFSDEGVRSARKGALGVIFIEAGDSRFDVINSRLTKAYALAKRGEWTALKEAVWRRLPGSLRNFSPRGVTRATVTPEQQSSSL